MRPHSVEVKNTLVSAALLFTARVQQHPSPPQDISGVCGVLLSPCASIYIVNDIPDRERDRHHPTKRYRPIASGSFPSGWRGRLLSCSSRGAGVSPVVARAVWGLAAMVSGAKHALLSSATSSTSRSLDVAVIALGVPDTRAVSRGGADRGLHLAMADNLCLLPRRSFWALPSDAIGEPSLGEQALSKPPQAALGEYSTNLLEHLFNHHAYMLAIQSYAIYDLFLRDRQGASGTGRYTLPVATYGLPALLLSGSPL